MNTELVVLDMAGTTVAWLKSEVDAWLDARAEERSRHVYADF